MDYVGTNIYELLDNLGVVLRIGHTLGVLLLGLLFWSNRPFKSSSEKGMFFFICTLFGYLCCATIWDLVGAYEGVLNSVIWRQLRQLFFNVTVGSGAWIWLGSIIWPLVKRK